MGGSSTSSNLGPRETLLEAVIDNFPAIVWVKGLDHRYLLVNRFAADIMGMHPDDIICMPDDEMFPSEVVEEWRKREEQVLATKAPFVSEDSFPIDDKPHTFHASVFPILDDEGEVIAFAGISTDVTALREAEEKRARLQEDVIRSQQHALLELSNPIVPVADGVVVMPLIGAVDTMRARLIVEGLLEKVTATGVHTAIIDLTGVPAIDTRVAEALMDAARACRLVGAEVMITGVQPEVAQTLVRMGIRLDDFRILATLKDGVAHALARGKSARGR
jgi:PAS domain S-box-containing protein